jgi:hypothetical protein
VTGEIGISGYDGLTFSEVMLILKGYNDRLLNEYRQTRLLMFMMAKMWGDPKKGVKSPEELWPLPGDENKAMTEDEIGDLFDRLKNNNG